MQTREHSTRRGRLALAAILLLAPSMALAETRDVIVGNNFFEPNDLTIQVGDTVRWTNQSGRTHDVTADDGSFASVTSSNFTFSRTFNSVAEILYHCSVHSLPGLDRDTNQNGRITVVEATGSAELAVQSVVAAAGEYAVGELLTVDISISNSGAAASGAFTVGYYASTDATITDGDQLLGSVQVADVAAGATLDRQDNLAVPDSLPEGVYFIGVIISFADSNAADNVGVDASAVTFFGPVYINAGMNDAWVNIDTLGQGLFFNVFSELEAMFIAWFTFDTELPDPSVMANLGGAGQRWVTGLGFYPPGNSVTVTMELTFGGLFNQLAETQDQIPGYGTVTITFRSCNHAELTYDFPGLGLAGTIELSRATTDNVELCKVLSAEIAAMH
jgi:plastocyanin